MSPFTNYQSRISHPIFIKVEKPRTLSYYNDLESNMSIMRMREPINALSNKMFSAELFRRGHNCTAKLAPHPHVAFAERNMLVFFARRACSLSP